MPDPVVPGMPSPVRLRGSFLHKDLSPKPSTTSPARRVQPGSENRLFGSGVRKKLAVDFMSDKVSKSHRIGCPKNNIVPRTGLDVCHVQDWMSKKQHCAVYSVHHFSGY